jgi:hypothetical protein
MKSIQTTASGGALTMPTLYQGTVTPGSPARQVSVGQFPASNPNWARTFQISDQYLFIKQGVYSVAISLADLTNMAFVVEPNLTWTPPVILLQPVPASCVHSSTAATFTITGGSEYTMTYQWQYSTDSGATWHNATGTVNGCVYTNGTTATLTCTPTTTGQTGALHRCIITDNASSPGSITSATSVLTIT